MYKKLVAIVVVGLLLAGCKKNLEPLDDNHRTLEDIYADPYFAEGVLMNAYTRLPTNSYSFNEVATDDAVTNDKASPLLNMATGSWSAAINPVQQWTNSYSAIMYLNLFLQEVEKVDWAPMSNKDVRTLFTDRLKGEAYGLRALFMFHLLQTHGGIGTDGRLLGVPVLTKVLTPESDFRTQRSTFDETVQQIYTDLAEADKYLPLDFVNIGSAAQLPTKYSNMAFADYNRVFGAFNRQRVSGRILKAIRAKVSLLAASPAFNLQNAASKWETAANEAAEVIKLNGGLSGLDAQGGLFYTASNVNAINLANNIDQREMLWRGNLVTSNNLERDNYPPSQFGNGRVNPSQNLVDAFPMVNGYPINHPSSNYDANNPYANRDPRLRNYIVVNGSTLRSVIWTKSDNPTNDAVNVLPTSTRTGYYLRKLLNESVNLNPAATNSQRHYAVHIRYTEMFLAYAEAANEAWGPDGMGTHGFSARQVIAAIRKRAGIAQPDNYLASVTNKEDMRQLIRNERRLELCFEGFRFWDLRRWKANLNEPAKGVLINNNTYTYNPVEIRQYADFMYYGPIPQTEALKANLQQNRGW